MPSGEHTDPVLVEEDDGILILTLNRPRRRNAVDLATAEAVAAAVDAFEDDENAHVLVVTGSGGTFCAGMDLAAARRGERPVIPWRGFAGFTERPPRKPVVAAVEGCAVGGGLEIVLSCDLVVSSGEALLSLPEVRRGLVPGAGALLRLPRRIPRAVAMEMALTGEPITGHRAYELGLVNVLTPPGQALPAAKTLARSVAAGAPLALQAAKRILVEGRSWHRDEEWSRQAEICEAVRDSEDAREGVAAFLEKRSPAWRGR